MARCPFLDYESNSWFGNSSDKFICKCTGEKMDVDDSQVKYTCKTDYGEDYKQCPTYQRN